MDPGSASHRGDDWGMDPGSGSHRGDDGSMDPGSGSHRGDDGSMDPGLHDWVTDLKVRQQFDDCFTALNNRFTTASPLLHGGYFAASRGCLLPLPHSPYCFLRESCYNFNTNSGASTGRVGRAHSSFFTGGKRWRRSSCATFTAHSKSG